MCKPAQPTGIYGQAGRGRHKKALHGSDGLQRLEKIRKRRIE